MAQVRFLKGWRRFRPGDTTDAIPDGVAELLRLRGRLEYMVPETVLEIQVESKERVRGRRERTTA